ncbi:hypothetical protein EDC96DRAFT_503403 [Choanephora cucurbitarum]|nr:hypothetical protein EDC96DRAFT_503403 [Choanephora cucurbitarum]
MASKGLEKTLEKLRNSVHAGNYYEAHQMYRTVARRYNKQTKYNDTIRLLFDGAILLMQSKQYGSGSDLANYMVDTYKLAHVPVEEASLGRIVDILALFPVDEAGRKPFISSAFRWTKEEGEYPEGDPDLHHYVGTMFFYEKKFSLAEDHLLLGTLESAKLLGQVAYTWAEEENVQAKGVFLARIALQFLASKDIHRAALTFDSFTESGTLPVAAKSSVRHAPVAEPSPVQVYSDAWINLVQLVLLTVQRDASNLFKELKEKYAPLYSQESNFVELMEDIGLHFFNIPKPRKQTNMIQEMMASLFSGGPAAGSGNLQLSGPKSSEDLD